MHESLAPLLLHHQAAAVCMLSSQNAKPATRHPIQGAASGGHQNHLQGISATLLEAEPGHECGCHFVTDVGLVIAVVMVAVAAATTVAVAAIATKGQKRYCLDIFCLSKQLFV